MSGGADHQIGDILLGKYQLMGVLGRGGMGVVYEAVDRRLGRHVAIKVLNAAARTRRDADQRFHLEARAIAALMHPHLVTLLDYDFLDDGAPAMVMERVDGISLKAMIVRRQFTPLEIVLVLYQTLLALSACHAKGVIHRDLKPENLLVTKEGPQGLTVKVIDFGLTKLLADEGATALTVNGQVFGSPRFMAPEQWLQKEVTGRTDIYALGLIGYCLVRGEHFITALNPFDICRAHMSQPRPALRTTVGGARVPALLDHVLRKAADPDPKNRYDSADAMIAALEPLTIDALSFTRFTGEHAASLPPSEDSGASPFDAAEMAASIDASMAAGDMPSIDETLPGIDPAFLPQPSRSPAARSPADSFEDDDADLQTIAEPARPMLTSNPSDPLATVLLQPALKLDNLRVPAPAAAPRDEPVPPTGETNRVKFAVAGGIFTAITKGDVDRAMFDAERASDDPPPEAPAPKAPAPKAPAPKAPAAPVIAAPQPISAPDTSVPTRPRKGPEARSGTVKMQAMRDVPRARSARQSMLFLALGLAGAVLAGAAVAYFWM